MFAKHGATASAERAADIAKNGAVLAGPGRAPS
jgi:hypothetical protein